MPNSGSHGLSFNKNSKNINDNDHYNKSNNDNDNKSNDNKNNWSNNSDSIMTVIVMMIIMILVIIIITTKIAKKTACLKTSIYAGLLLLQNLKIIEQMHCSKRSSKELQIYIRKLFLCPSQK